MRTSARAAGGITASRPSGSSSWWDNPHSQAGLVISVVLIAIAAGIVLRLIGYVGGAYSWYVFSSAGDDSWHPMGLAYARAIGQSSGSLYDLFFTDHVKFQYPASSLLLYSALDTIGIAPTPYALNVLVWFSILALPIVIFRLSTLYIETQPAGFHFSVRDKYAIAAAFAVATLFFYPVMISWRLGQVQAFINLLFACACVQWLRGAKGTAGILIGVTCLIKPQFALFCLWALLRGESKFALGQVAVVVAGTLLSLLLYGWDNNIFYIDVLSYISQHGETFWDNTSINGFLNTIANPDETLIFQYHEFPQFNLAVYVLTLISSAAIIGAALLARRSGSLLDLMTAGLSFTLASPIAWGHHYGVVLPILVVAFIEIATCKATSQRPVLFAVWTVCFLLFCNNWNVSQLAAGTYVSFLQSWRLFAALALLALLYRLQFETGSADERRYARGRLWEA